MKEPDDIVFSIIFYWKVVVFLHFRDTTSETTSFG